MKCPKCGYLGFEQVERCRNCGYDFSLTQDGADPELALQQRGRDYVNPLEDLSFLKEAEAPAAAPPAVRPADLPLFGAPADDEPLITRASPPRSPLGVRRATPEGPRLRSDPRAQSFDLAFESPSSAPARAGRNRGAPDEQGLAHESASGPGEAETRDASVIARFAAVAIDLVILAIVDVLVMYFTMEICGVGVLDFGIIPKAPLLTFLVVQNGGYLVAFTAGGQTLGKMAAGIRVVMADETESLDVGRAALRIGFWCMLAIPLGLGFMTVLSSDRRGLHDRVAGTRVVRASA